MIKNNKCVVLIFFIFCALGVAAQDNSKYLAGAVPEVDGKVVFSKTINVMATPSAAQIYSLMKTWAEKEYSTSEDNLQNRILLSDPKTNDIACQGESYLTFKSTSFVLDRAKMIYQLIIHAEDGRCSLTIRNIRYDYPNNKKLLTAEEMISDKQALNKEKTKLYRDNDKFRIHTVDMVARIFDSVELYLNGKITLGAVANANATQAEPPVADTAQVAPPINMIIDVKVPFPPLKDKKKAEELMPDFSRVVGDELNKTLGRYLFNEKTLLISGTSNDIDIVNTFWGGKVNLWSIPMVFNLVLLDSSDTEQTAPSGDVYTISFFEDTYKGVLSSFDTQKELNGINAEKLGLTPIKTPSGATAFAEASLIIECRKLATQLFTSQMQQSTGIENSNTGKLCVGQVLEVWKK